MIYQIFSDTFPNLFPKLSEDYFKKSKSESCIPALLVNSKLRQSNKTAHKSQIKFLNNRSYFSIDKRIHLKSCVSHDPPFICFFIF